MEKHGYTKGGKRTSEYYAWVKMRIRCTNPKQNKYECYGGRGITFCEEWKSFSNFIRDMGLKPGPEYSLDRIDNNGNYEPSNCRWATRSEQMNNTRASVIISAYGKKMTRTEWARKLNVTVDKVRKKFKKNLAPERAIASLILDKLNHP